LGVFLAEPIIFLPALAKKRIIKDYDALSEDIIASLRLKYPTGYAEHLVTYLDREGKKVSALPFETDEAYYLVRMTKIEAKRLESEDDLEDDVALREDAAANVDVDDEFTGHDDDDDMADGSNDEDDHIIITRRRDEEAGDIADESDY
jgi:DNA-directed RNA polymerase subunit delta